MKEKFNDFCIKYGTFIIYVCGAALILNTVILFFGFPFAPEEYEMLICIIIGILEIPSLFIVQIIRMTARYEKLEKN